MDHESTALQLKPRPDFVATPWVREVADRALGYLAAGYPVHFSGPAGTGKTTLAMHLAALVNRPVVLLHGDDEFGSSDLVGDHLGFRSTKVVDNFIHSVVKTEQSVSKTWVDHRLTTACRHGFTLIYDEFNRSRPEANNILLTILEERLLELPPVAGGRDGSGPMRVHPEFRAIFTSNPEEYAGVHKTQDALLDRMITIAMGGPDVATETEITDAKTGLARDDAARNDELARAVRLLKPRPHPPTIRSCLMIAKVAALRGVPIDPVDGLFLAICRDVLRIDTLPVEDPETTFAELIRGVFAPTPAAPPPRTVTPTSRATATPAKAIPPTPRPTVVAATASPSLGANGHAHAR